MGVVGGRRSTGGASSESGEEQAAEDGLSSSMTVLRPRTACSPVGTVVALALWLGAIHLNVFLLLASVFFLSRSTAMLVLGTQVLLMFVRVSDTNRWGRKIARFICKHAVSYFPITLHFEDYASFDPSRAYVFGYEPHSVWPLGLWVLAGHVGFVPLPNMKILAANAALYVPFQRQIWTWMGTIPASMGNFVSHLTAGFSCVVVPGGVREMFHLDHHPDSEVIFIKSRKGFVRVAVQTGSPLVPVFCFGQSNTYSWRRSGNKLLIKACRAMRLPPVMLSWGKFGTSIPFRSPLHVFVGKPIEVKKNEQPTFDEVNQVHEQFVAALQELFHRHKNEAGYPRLHLRVI